MKQFALILGILAFTHFASAQPSKRDKADKHSHFTALLREHVKNGRVDYEGFAKSKLFDTYLDFLSNASLKGYTKNDLKAFWINAYNASTIKLILQNKGTESILNIQPDAWREQFFTVAGRKLTLDEIEKKILIQELGEVRVHFACVCAAKSCPVLQSEAYEGSTLEWQLENAAKNFINDPTRNFISIGNKSARLAQIFNWYQHDFASAGGVKAFIARYLDEPKRKWLLDSVQTIEYNNYDWSLNSK